MKHLTRRLSLQRLLRYMLLIAASLAASALYAHTPLFDCFDNGDATITCEGGFSDGASAEGVDIKLIDAQGRVLAQGKLDENSSITFTRPESEFSVIFGQGADHSITVFGDDIY